ncbi:MAG TPA: amino acid ABC transporter permease [Anaerolineae bacterium]|nr:amino acid ABC transporter permease [Anaerolineae bacterium]
MDPPAAAAVTAAVTARRSARQRLADLPWWLVLLLAAAAWWLVTASGDLGTQATLRVLMRGLAVTVRVTLVSFALALVIGTAVGLGRVSPRRWLRELATLYVEVVRGVPLLVLILWIGYALVPTVITFLAAQLRDLAAAGHDFYGWGPRLAAACRRPADCASMELRGVLGLAIGYGAYVAEIVRAGIEAVARGQWEAASSLGLGRAQVLRLVVLPQALRVAMPPLGNDFVAMLKDSALISVLAVPDIVQEARQHVAKTFKALEVWNLVALVYLVLTVLLSLGLRRLERHLAQGRQGAGDA